MKKEVVSVLKPRARKKTENKVKKVVPKEITVEKKKKSGLGDAKPRGAKPNLLNNPTTEITRKPKKGSNLQTDTSEETKKTNEPTKVPKKLNKKRKVETSAESESVAVREDREDGAPHANPKKKRKVQPVVSPSVADKKTQKKLSKKVSSTTEKNVGPTIKKLKSDVAVRKKAKDSKTSNNVQSDPAKEHEMETSGHLKLTSQHILGSIKAIKKLTQKALASKKSILPTDNHPVLLQVTCVKIPKTPRRQIRSSLPHPIISPSDDIAIFVADLELGRRKDYEKTVDHWETIFREKGVDCIKQIIPMNQVKTEYNQFEMKRKLAESFDYFFADGKICGHLTHLLGKDFFKRRNAPTPVKLSRASLKEELETALHKTCMEVHSYGNTHTVRVGTMSMKSAKLAENVWEMCKALANHYPGGWANIRTIHLKTQKSESIPIYISLSTKNKVAVPVVRPKRPRAYETVEGELSTLAGDVSVKVTPEGKVRVIKKEVSKDGEENDNSEEEEEEEEEEDDVMDSDEKVKAENTDEENNETDENDGENNDDDDE